MSTTRTLCLLLSLIAVTGCGDDEEKVIDNDSDGFTSALDCDDNNASINPNAQELCDGVDNDCDGDIDGENASDKSTWYADSDGDGFGNADVSQSACSVPDGYTEDSTDCDDSDPQMRPDDQDSDGYSSWMEIATTRMHWFRPMTWTEMVMRGVTVIVMIRKPIGSRPSSA